MQKQTLPTDGVLRFALEDKRAWDGAARRLKRLSVKRFDNVFTFEF